MNISVQPSTRFLLSSPFRYFLYLATALASCLSVQHASAAAGDLYVADGAGVGHIYKFDATGHKSTFASGFLQPVALAFDRAGNLFVGNSGAGTLPVPSTVIKITPDGTESLFATLQSSQLLGMAFDGAGNLFVSEDSDILKIAPDGTKSTFASIMDGVGPLAFDELGNLYAGFSPTGPSSILKFAPDGSSTTLITFAAGTSVVALAFDGNGDLFVTKLDSIVKVTRDGNSTPFASGEFEANSLAFDSHGLLFAGLLNASGLSDPAIVKFTPAGVRTTFVSGPLSPNSIAFEPVTEKLRNISARGFVQTDENVLIAGLIVGGNALATNSVVIRAIGPSLSHAGIANPLQDPTLELRNSSGALITSNDDWQDTQAAQITASGLAPTDTHESAIFANLPAGGYTAIVRGANNTTGVAVVEAYNLSN
jgi:sugar lactone lactonase YvrE